MIKERTKTKRNMILACLLGVAAIALIVLVVVFVGKGTDALEQGNAYHDAEESSVPLLVDFDPLVTTEEEYSRMYDVCSEYIDGDQGKYAVASYSVGVNVTEDTFVDAEETPDGPGPDEQDEYTEYDRAYFTDFLMVRYVSQSGAIQVIGTWLNRDGTEGTEIELVNQTEFSTSHFTVDQTETTGWTFWMMTQEEVEEDSSVSEDVFVSCLGECVVGALTDSVDTQKLNSHFTAEGRADLLRIVQVLGIDAEQSIGVVLGAVGTSDLGNEAKDRVYLRCELLNGDGVTYLNLLIKLNSNLMVFDMDLI